MSDQIDDGGFAFPVLPPICGDGHPPAGYPYPQPGMSLRDWFAGMAMQGILSAADSDEFEYYDPAMEHAKWVPVTAYSIADAMIAARKGGAK